MDKNTAKILAEFTDKLNQYGAESKELAAFRAKYEGDKELAKLFATTVRVQAQLKAGQLAALPDDSKTLNPKAKQNPARAAGTR